MSDPQTDYGLEETASGVSGVFTSETASKAGQFAKHKISELKTMASDGHISIRVLAEIGGLSMCLLSVMGFVVNIINLAFLGALVEVYTFLMGLVVIILESKAFPKRYEQALSKYALFLCFVWGRGCLYFVAGSLQATQGKIADGVVGGYMCLVGIIYLIVGRRTAKKLSDLRKSLISEEDLQLKFREVDLDDSGTITKGQFKTLTVNMGLDLGRREVEAAMMYLDKEDAGEITYEEFQNWWLNWEATDSPNKSFDFV